MASESRKDRVEPFGRVWPNLVLIRDSGNAYVEFRVQCEVLLPDEEEVHSLETALSNKSKASLKEACELVLRRAENATPTFKEIVRLAFEDQPVYTEQESVVR